MATIPVAIKATATLADQFSGPMSQLTQKLAAAGVVVGGVVKVASEATRAFAEFEGQ